MVKKVVIFEDSSKVSFGGGQNISLKVSDVLSKDCELLFIDFSCESRYIQIVNERFPTQIKLIFKSNIFGEIRNRSLQILNEAICYFLYRNKNIQKLTKVLIDKDCIIYATTRRALLYAYIINKRYKIPYVYHAHLVENKNSISYGVIKKALRKAEKIICVSKVVQNSIGLNNTVLLYNPSPNIKEAKKEKIDNKFVIAGVGSLIPIKGFEYFAKSAVMFANHSNVEFRIYGEGNQKLQLEKIGNGKVLMKGFCSDIVQELIDEVDIVVLPSIIEEALPTVIIEAKSVGIPVITTNIGGQEEIVQDGIDGFLVPIRSEKAIFQKLIELTSNSELYRMISKASYKSATKFSFDEFQKSILIHIGKK